jgi:hypothetical protein
MPPETPPTLLPKDRGRSARNFLESEGLVPRTPTIRSSDYKTALSDPFGYYLRRRLGIIPALSYSEALSRGSYFHILFALYDKGDRQQIFKRMCQARLAEINKIAKELRISENARATAIENEVLDQAMAASWYNAFENLPCLNGNSALDILLDNYTKLGAEYRLTWVDERFPKTRQVAQFDLLLHNRKTNKIWIVDAKTTAAPPLIRLSTVKEEFQTMHYLHALEWFMSRGLLHKQFPKLPEDVQLGGMMHIAILKPSIQFGQADRDFHWESDGKRTGIAGRIMRSPVNLKDLGDYVIKWTSGYKHPEPIVGTMDECLVELHRITGKKPERVYQGEPSISKYQERCMRWYKGEGEYLDRAPDFDHDPPVNISYTHASTMLDNDWRLDYLDRVAMIYNLATRDPYPCNFLKNIDGLRMGSKLALYSPFYLTEPKEWPALVQSQQFLLAHRDEGIPELDPEHQLFLGALESLEPELPT